MLDMARDHWHQGLRDPGRGEAGKVSKDAASSGDAPLSDVGRVPGRGFRSRG